MKRKNWLKLIFGTSAVTLVFGHAYHLWADEELPKKKRVVVIESDAAAEKSRKAVSEYWIGIRCEESDSGVFVGEVVAGSPAEKAGLMANDIINRVNDADIDNVKTLIDNVQKSRGKEVEIKVTRGEEDITLKVTPSERPKIRFGDRFQGHPRFGPLFRDYDFDGDLDLQFLNPGIIFDDRDFEFPKGTKIEIKRENDKPAKITIERDGKSWAVDEQTIDELPEDLRELAKRTLSGMSRRKIQVPKDFRLPNFNFDGLPKQFQEQIRIGGDDRRDKEFAELRKEIKELREMIEKLQK